MVFFFPCEGPVARQKLPSELDQNFTSPHLTSQSGTTAYTVPCYTLHTRLLLNAKCNPAQRPLIIVPLQVRYSCVAGSCLRLHCFHDHGRDSHNVTGPMGKKRQDKGRNGNFLSHDAVVKRGAFLCRSDATSMVSVQSYLVSVEGRGRVMQGFSATTGGEHRTGHETMRVMAYLQGSLPMV